MFLKRRRLYMYVPNGVGNIPLKLTFGAYCLCSIMCYHMYDGDDNEIYR